MSRVVLLVSFLAACGPGPVATCSEPGVDCCKSDDECLDWFGTVYPFCENPGRTTGVCGECRADVDCGPTGRCEQDPDFGGYCIEEG